MAAVFFNQVWHNTELSQHRVIRTQSRNLLIRACRTGIHPGGDGGGDLQSGISQSYDDTELS
eukprot:176076-Pyramimonas_sp.AAC.1